MLARPDSSRVPAPAHVTGVPLDRARVVVVEVLRLLVVVLALSSGYAAGPTLLSVVPDVADAAPLLGAVVGALLGYVVGGFLSRLLVSGVDQAQRRIQRVESSVLVAVVIGVTLGLVVGFVLAVPLLLVPARGVAAPLAVMLVVLCAYTGARLGAVRGGDLSRWMGVRGRLEVVNPSRGGAAKLVDTSALMDGRLVDVARRGFLDGTLVVPMFVLHELQAVADGSDRRRAGRALRGLDALHTLEQEALVAVEVSDEDVAGVRDVDAKLAALCRARHAALVTVDGNLERIAEIAGIRVLNLHGLADALRPPVVPGDEVALHLERTGQQAGQAVGHLEDGTMVVVEDAGDLVGQEIEVHVTSITQTRRGRMLFARPAAA